MDDWNKLHRIYGYLNRILEHSHRPPLFRPGMGPVEFNYAIMLLLWLTADHRASFEEADELWAAFNTVFDRSREAA